MGNAERVTQQRWKMVGTIASATQPIHPSQPLGLGISEILIVGLIGMNRCKSKMTVKYKTL